ncbi:MAG: DUF1598 domain-containing protein [Planctomycetales bacterium]
MIKSHRVPVCMAAAFLIAVVPAIEAEGQFQTTIQLPTFGVSVDADGVLQAAAFTDPEGQLHAKRLAAAKAALPPNIQKKSPFRKVSLVRLEREIQQLLDAGKPIGDELRNLAGLQRLEYVFYYPDEADIVIAGPAEGWLPDPSGRTVGMTTGRPVLELQDLLVALRMYPPGSNNRPFIGCTISPTEDGLARLQKFQRTIPQRIPQQQREVVAERIAKGTREALGMSDVHVYGIPPTTHFSHVLLEADLRMKRIGIGLEPPPVKMATFLGVLQRPSGNMLQRWWFQPDYDCIRVTKDHSALQLTGHGVQLLSEDMAIGPDGQLLDPKAKVGKASRLFTQSFTKKYPKIAAASPVYAQLRNCIDMLIAAAFIRHQDYYGQAGWSMPLLVSEDSLPTEILSAARQVDCNVNVQWKGNRLISPAGGVSVSADRALDEKNWQVDEDGKLRKIYREANGDALPNDSWWWD